MQTRVRIYGLYLDGEKVFEGSAVDIEKNFHISHSSVASYVAINRKIEGKYDIKKERIESRQIIKEKNIVVQVKPKKEVDMLKDKELYLKHHLTLCGNTVCSFDPRPYLEKLGLDCVVKEVTDFVPITTHKRGRRPKPKYHYLVEMRNGSN